MQSLNVMDGSIFFKNKELSKKKIEFPLKPDDIIMMSSNVHEWKGKPRSIVCVPEKEGPMNVVPYHKFCFKEGLFIGL